VRETASGGRFACLREHAAVRAGIEMSSRPMKPNQAFKTRHIVSINDLSNQEIDAIFRLAEQYLDRLSDQNCSYRISRSTNVASEFILASLFYEPSTRTRLSFESAMLRLGGDIITSSDPATSSAAKGESLADSVRVIANYADVMVIRHPRDGAARLAAEYSRIPVINGGDGSHEHPTQTLCDIFTLKKKNKDLKNLKVAISGDLKGSRTIHSFVYALARFGARIVPMPAPGMELPAHVRERLRTDFRCEFDAADGSIGALYKTPEEPHQPALFAGPEFEFSVDPHDSARARATRSKKIAAVYVTRFQKERWPAEDRQYPKIDAKFLREPKYSRASLLHPLPRVDELDVALDNDQRATYFEQAAYGVPLRMALISLLLGVGDAKALSTFSGGFATSKFVLYQQPLGLGIRCANPNCIVHDEKEAPYVRNKFHLVGEASAVMKLRCLYCESDIDQFVVASRKNRWFTADAAAFHEISDQNVRDFVFFADETHAVKNGFHSRKHSRPKKAAAAR
jgi:aspartate carbamoyltransferase catalytic subunit